MKTTPYFDKNMREKRPYLLLEWCQQALVAPDHKLVQPDGRVRYYKYIVDAGKFIRVITLEDGETLHNVFFDRNFKPKGH